MLGNKGQGHMERCELIFYLFINWKANMEAKEN